MPSCFEKSKGIVQPTPERAPTTPEISNKSMLDRLEIEMAQQLRILNMQQMMKDIRNPPKPQAQQSSEMETFTKFLTLQKTMRDEILEDLPDEIDEGGSFEEKAALKLIEGYMGKRNATPPLPMEKEQQKEVQEEMIPTADELEEGKRKIKSGEMSFEEMKAQVKAAYPTISFTDKQLRAEFEKIKNS